MSLPVEAHSINQEIRKTISARYKRITHAVNRSFWNIESDTAHSFYVGSYGRGTAITTSDLDVLMELPADEFDHFSNLAGNGQSRLLQVVKNAIIETYPQSSIKADGQVVCVDFADDISFEILPAFKNEDYWGWNGTYKYPDTNMGGNWKSTNPKAEIEAMKEKNDETNGLLFATCQHIRFIRDNYYSSYHLSGILIDSFVYRSIGQWHFLRAGESSTGQGESYEQYLIKQYNETSLYGIIPPSLFAPGSEMAVDTSSDWTVLGKVLNKMK